MSGGVCKVKLAASPGFANRQLRVDQARGPFGLIAMQRSKPASFRHSTDGIADAGADEHNVHSVERLLNSIAPLLLPAHITGAGKQHNGFGSEHGAPNHASQQVPA